MPSMESIPRFLLPRPSPWRTRLYTPPRIRSHQKARSFFQTTGAQAKQKPVKDGLVATLEKPTRFNPPSHPSKPTKKRQLPRTYGPELSKSEQEAQKTKKYPHMMPSEGTFMHWFLTSRSLHMWITMGTLGSLATFTLFTNFRATSPFAHLLPPTSDLIYHPFSFCATYLRVYKMHVNHNSQTTQERRKRKVDDAMKRKQYRNEHGIAALGAPHGDQEGEEQSKGLWGTVRRWVGRLGEESDPKTAKTTQMEQNVGLSPTELALGGASTQPQKGGEDEYVDFEGIRKKQPKVKKWLGIWE